MLILLLQLQQSHTLQAQQQVVMLSQLSQEQAKQSRSLTTDDLQHTLSQEMVHSPLNSKMQYETQVALLQQ